MAAVAAADPPAAPPAPPAAPLPSPAMQRVAAVGLAATAAADFTACVELKGELGLTWEPRTVPAPPPAPPCRVKTIRPGSPASKAQPAIHVGDWLTHVQGTAVSNYFEAMTRINTSPRPLKLGLVSGRRKAPQPQPEPELEREPEASRASEFACPDVRLYASELEELAQLSAAEQLALDPLPSQPSQRRILNLEVEARVTAEQRVGGGTFCVAAAQRLQLLAGDTLVAPSPTGEYRVTIGPDEDAEAGDMDLLEIAAKQFDGTHAIEDVDGVAAVSCRVSVSCVGHAFRAGLRLQIPHCARTTTAVTALWAPQEHGPWQALPPSGSVSFSTAAGEQVGEVFLREDPGPGWVVLVRCPELVPEKVDERKPGQPKLKLAAADADATISVPRKLLEPEDSVYMVLRPVERPVPLVDTDDLDGPLKEVRREQDELQQRPDAAHGGTSARPPTAVKGPNGVRSALSSVYRCHNSAKLAEIDEMLIEWRGNELELLDYVRRKYDAASNRLRLPVDTDVSVMATMGPLLSAFDTAGALAVYGPFYVCRGVWYTLQLNLLSGANRITSGPTPAAGVFLPVQQRDEPQRYLASRRTEFALRVRVTGSPLAAALAKQLAICDDLRYQLKALTSRNEDVELPPEAVNIKLQIPGADKMAQEMREQREVELLTHALPTDFLDGMILNAVSSTGERARYYCHVCLKMFTPDGSNGRVSIKCLDCGQLATRKQIVRTGVRVLVERIGVCNGIPEPIWSATAVVDKRRLEEREEKRRLKEEARARAAAIAGAVAAAAEATDGEPTGSRSCSVQ